jgi:hypothetical protein
MGLIHTFSGRATLREVQLQSEFSDRSDSQHVVYSIGMIGVGRQIIGYLPVRFTDRPDGSAKIKYSNQPDRNYDLGYWKIELSKVRNRISHRQAPATIAKCRQLAGLGVLSRIYDPGKRFCRYSKIGVPFCPKSHSKPS